jgi:hypothetical protein
MNVIQYYVAISLEQAVTLLLFALIHWPLFKANLPSPRVYSVDAYFELTDISFVKEWMVLR